MANIMRPFDAAGRSTQHLRFICDPMLVRQQAAIFRFRLRSASQLASACAASGAEQFDLFFAADKLQHAGTTQRVKAVPAVALSPVTRHANAGSMPSLVLRAPSLAIEEATEKLARGGSYYDAVRRRCGLQVLRKIQWLAGHRIVLGASALPTNNTRSLFRAQAQFGRSRTAILVLREPV